MTNLKFEQMLSFNPKINNGLSTICLRDMIYQYFVGITSTEEKANQLTKEYIAKLHEKVL